MNRQSRLRFSMLRAKILKQYYVQRKCKGKPQNAFGPTLPLKQSQLYSSKCHTKQSDLQATRTKLSLSTSSFSPPSAKRTLFEHLSQRLKLLNLLYQTALRVVVRENRAKC